MEVNAAQTDVQRHERPESAVARSRVITALSRVEQGQRDGMEDLRVALCAYVTVLRQQGLSREATLAGVEALIAVPTSGAGGTTLTPLVRQALAELTLEWCSAEYDRLDPESTR